MRLSVGKAAVAIVALAAACYGLAEFRGPNGYSSLVEKRREMQKLEQDNRMFRDEIDRLAARIDKLNHDPDAQELEIRKRLGLVRPGEKVYVLNDKEPPVRSIPPPPK